MEISLEINFAEKCSRDYCNNKENKAYLVTSVKNKQKTHQTVSSNNNCKINGVYFLLAFIITWQVFP